MAQIFEFRSRSHFFKKLKTFKIEYLGTWVTESGFFCMTCFLGTYRWDFTHSEPYCY